MPPKKVTILPVGQGNISLFFKKAAATATPKSDKPVAEKPAIDNEVQKFYDSLSEKEKIAHQIAQEMLGTSYDVTRTHGFLAKRK
jgi:hypothetical protein